MPRIFAWTLNEAYHNAETVEFFTSPKTRLLDSTPGYEIAEIEAKKHRKKADQAALTLFELEVSQHVLDSISNLSVQRGLMNLGGASQTSDVMRLQLRCHQFSESGHVSYNLENEIVSASGSLNDKSKNIAEPPKFPTTQASITEADVPWYLKAARWIGQHIWGFGWLADWAQSKIEVITDAHNLFALGYVETTTTARIGTSVSTIEPVITSSLYAKSDKETASDTQPLRSPTFSNSSDSDND